jgi:hypothetical protein
MNAEFEVCSEKKGKTKIKRHQISDETYKATMCKWFWIFMFGKIWGESELFEGQIQIERQIYAFST